jgi:hypothetical protein
MVFALIIQGLKQCCIYKGMDGSNKHMFWDASEEVVKWWQPVLGK